MEILIIGTGYVGLVTGTCFAQMGHIVTCLDIDKNKIEKLNKNIPTIYEKNLFSMIKKNKKEKRLFFTDDYNKVKDSLAIFLCLPTPCKKDGSCDTSFLEKAAKEISKHINDYKLIINKSTAPMGTLFKLKELIKKETKIKFDVASNPEFLKEGSAVDDCMKPDRIIIGSNSQKAFQILEEIYSPFMVNRDKIIKMDILSAEMSKYAANAMLATRISFMNELSHICKEYGADINSVRKAIGSDRRIGSSFLYAGVGYGGSCFPKDIKALCSASKKKGYTPILLEAVEAINNNQKKELFKIIKKYFEKKGGLKNKTIAIWGLSFKPDTDDMREAPSLTLIKELNENGVKLRVFDPVAMKNAKNILKFLLLKKDFKNIYWSKDEFDAANGSDGIALLTEWKQFRLINFENLKNLKNKVLFDGRNQYNPLKMKKNGFEYIGIGVKKIVKKNR